MLAPSLYAAVMGVEGVEGVTLPPDPIQEQPNFDSALAAFEQLPAVRILFDNGAGSATPGNPLPAFEASFCRFPIPGTKGRSWFFGNHGALARGKPPKPGAEAFTWDPAARPPTDFTGDTGAGAGGLWTATPNYDWAQNPPGTAASYVSAPLGSTTTVTGAGALEAWVRASARSVDLQATVSEVRPDGKETFVQSGWLRTSVRALDPKKSTPLEPVLSLRKSDAAPLPKGRWAKVTVPLYYEGHAYRAGSRIRVTIAAAGGDQPVWAFGETRPVGSATVRIAHSRSMPSRLLLPVVPGVAAPTGLAPCPGLRGEPCRDFLSFSNREIGLR